MYNSRPVARSQIDGFSLIELIVVLAIVGILFLVALPTFEQYQLKTSRALASAELLTVLARQEQFFANNKRYAPTLDLLGYSGSPYAINSNAEDVAVSVADRIYNIELRIVTSALYELKAVPQRNQAKDSLCGSLELTSRGGKSTSTGAGIICW